MNRHTFFALAFIASCCASKTESSSVTGNTDTVETLTSPSFAESTGESYQSNAYDSARKAVDKLIALTDEEPDTYYTMRVVNAGYENQSETIWTFDKDLKLIRYYQSGSAEAYESVYWCFYQNNEILAHLRESYIDGHIADGSIAHKIFGAFYYSFNEAGEVITAPTPLDANYLRMTEREINNQYHNLRTLLKETPVEEAGEEVMLRMQDQRTEGEFEFTETIEITIDRVLFRHLIE